MWHVIDGLGTKKMQYKYNSQNQVIELTYQNGESDYMQYYHWCDDAGRLSVVQTYQGLSLPNFVAYNYNENSQVQNEIFGEAGSVIDGYYYNKRNWIDSLVVQNFFNHHLTYLYKGNVSNQTIGGSYTSNFSNSCDGQNIGESMSVFLGRFQ